LLLAAKKLADNDAQAALKLLNALPADRLNRKLSMPGHELSVASFGLQERGRVSVSLATLAAVSRRAARLYSLRLSLCWATCPITRHARDHRQNSAPALWQLLDSCLGSQSSRFLVLRRPGQAARALLNVDAEGLRKLPVCASPAARYEHGRQTGVR
jgi:hypothetical protein